MDSYQEGNFSISDKMSPPWHSSNFEKLCCRKKKNKEVSASTSLLRSLCITFSVIFMSAKPQSVNITYCMPASMSHNVLHTATVQ